jgi:pyruvate/2-oxoglutarate dehydrogenase complex dihydrolipoamide dehydrogenase (E3) component
VDYDVIVIGAGAAGEAAGETAGELGSRVATVERDLVGGECSFWACMPSKSLLNSAWHRAVGAEYPWERAAARRDWMISREDTPYQSDAGHVARAKSAGVEIVRGTARIVGPGRVEVASNGTGTRTLEGKNLVVAVGSVPFIPPVDGLADVTYWTSRDATAVRELPSSIVILGGGPVGVEMAQVFVRFGVKTTLVEGGDRILARDHPRSSEVVTAQLSREGLDVRTGVRATAVRMGGAGRVIELSDGTSVEGAEILVAVGRMPADLRELGADEAGAELDDRGRVAHDERMKVADGLYVAGDVAGGLQFTHVADYEGRVAVRAALGREVRADLDTVPRATYTDPETGAVGLFVEEAQERGIDAFEVTADFATSSRGFTLEQVGGDLREGAPGHVTAVVDRERGVLVGAFAACPGASDLIHEAVLTVKAQIPVAVVADTIHAFPAGSRVFGNLMADAAKQIA